MCLGVPGQILTVTGDDPITRMGRVNFGGVVKEVSLAYTPDATVGDYVVVHVGFAISQVDEEEAALVFDYLRQMDELDEIGVKRKDDEMMAECPSSHHPIINR